MVILPPCCPHRFTEASVNGADRIRQLTLAGNLIHKGHVIDAGWLAAALLDFRDLLTHMGVPE